jgi:hypothetical protein
MAGRMFSLACLFGLITAVTNVHAWWWTGIRIGVLMLLVLFAFAWLEAARKDRLHR